MKSWRTKHVASNFFPLCHVRVCLFTHVYTDMRPCTKFVLFFLLLDNPKHFQKPFWSVIFFPSLSSFIDSFFFFFLCIPPTRLPPLFLFHSAVVCNSAHFKSFAISRSYNDNNINDNNNNVSELNPLQFDGAIFPDIDSTEATH